MIYSTFPECRYFLALHRPGSSKLILQPTPVYLISRQIKALKNFKSTQPDSSEYSQARSTLGKVFGTKKAKTAIRAQERNKIDVSAMGDVAGVLQDRIDEATENLPTQAFLYAHHRGRTGSIWVLRLCEACFWMGTGYASVPQQGYT